MTTRELADFRRREAEALRRMSGEDRTAPGTRAAFARRRRWCLSQVKLLTGREGRPCTT